MTVDAVSHVAPAPRRRRSRRIARLHDEMLGVSLLAGPANVIMELAQPGVGYGVLESRVESGRVDRHPIKRARTTFTYVAVALRGARDRGPRDGGQRRPAEVGVDDHARRVDHAAQ